MSKYLVTVPVTMPDGVTAQMIADYFNDALAEHDNRVREDNGYDWPADQGYIGNATVTAAD